MNYVLPAQILCGKIVKINFAYKIVPDVFKMVTRKSML